MVEFLLRLPPSFYVICDSEKTASLCSLILFFSLFYDKVFFSSLSAADSCNANGGAGRCIDAWSTNQTSCRTSVAYLRMSSTSY